MMAARSASLVFALTASLFWGGCGCDPGGGSSTQSAVVAVPATPATLAIEIGLGSDTFAPVTDGATVPVVYGPQGGQHVWTSLRMRDAGLSVVRVNLSARFADNGEPAGEPSGWIAEMSTPMEGVRTHAGMKSYLTFDGTPRRVILRAEVIGTDGSHGEDERTVLVSR